MNQVHTKNNGIQILRAFLLMGIIAFHCGVRGTEFLWCGVEAFFVLSSIFLTKKLMNIGVGCEINLRKEITYRFKRLYPIYFVLLIGVTAITIILNHIIPIKDLIIHGILFQNFNWMVSGYVSELQVLTAHTWTLAIEIWLFLLWIVAFKLISSRKGRIFF